MSWRKGPTVNRRRWKLVREAVLKRDGYLCQKCGVVSGDPEVDHVMPIAKGGAIWDLSNLQTLCAFPCHRDKTSVENQCQLTPERDAWKVVMADYLRMVK